MPVFNVGTPPDLLGQVRATANRLTSDGNTDGASAVGSRLSKSIAQYMNRGTLSPLDEIRADSAAADTAHKIALVEELRRKIDERAASERRRNDPMAQSQYASDVAGIDTAAGVQAFKALRGITERPPIENDDEGNRMPDVAFAMPTLRPGQREAYQRSLAALEGTRMATGTTNAEQLAHAGGRLQQQALIDQAANAPNAEAGNRAVSAAFGHLRTPFRTNEHGITTNQETGTINEGGSLAQSNIALTGARTAAERAHAGERSAHAGLYVAQTDKVKKEANGGDEGLPAQQFRNLTGAKLSDLPAEVRLQWMQNAAAGMPAQDNLASLRQAARRDALVNEARLAYEAAYPKTMMGQRPTGAPDFMTFADSYVSQKEGGARVPQVSGGRETRGRVGGPASRGADQVARPRTQADFDSLPRGATYIDPDDGKTYRKP